MRPHKHSTLQALFFIGLFLVPTAAGQVAKPSLEQAHATSAPLLSHPPEQLSMPEKRARIIGSYGKLPLSFEANQGQLDADVKFLSRGANYTVFLAGDKAVLTLPTQTREAKVDRSDTRSLPLRMDPKTLTSPLQSTPTETEAVLEMGLIGTNEQAKVEGLDLLPGKMNYFLGNDPQKWRTNVPTYATVKYIDIYPGIDLTYYGNQQQLECDFVVSPGADAHALKLAFKGAEDIKVGPEGDLLLKMKGRLVRFRKPVIYQPDPQFTDGRALVDGGYAVKSRNEITFEFAHYDKAKPLVIDPILQYSTYLGGSNRDRATGIAVDGSGNAYVAGTTRSSNFPTLNPVQSFSGGSCGTPPAVLPCRDIFVTKFNPAGSAIIYSTFIGGSDDDIAQSIALDTSQNAYITGSTLSSNFPATSGAFQTNYGGSGSLNTGDAFVTKLDATGSMLVYSTYLGGSGDESAFTVAVDSAGNAYFPGFTTSSNFPSTGGAYKTACTNPQTVGLSCYDAFVAELNPTGSALVYSTFLGGSAGGIINSATGLAIDSAGNAYVGGITGNHDFPIVGAFKTSCGKDGACDGSTDGFIAKLNSTGSALIFSTFLGGEGFDNVNAVAVDQSGAVYATGSTVSPDFPVTNNAPQKVYGGGSCTTFDCGDAFLTVLSPQGSSLVFSTYIGGSGDDGGEDLALDPFPSAYVTGVTTSKNFPTNNAFQPTYGGGISDGFVTKVTPGNTTFTYSTYLGGTGQDLCTRVAVDGSGNAYVVGGTSSSDFPITPAVFQTQNAGSQDAFVAVLVIASSPTTITGVTPNPSLPGQSVTVNFSVAPVPPANGTPTGNVTVSDGVDSCVATVAQGSCSLVFPTWGTYFLTASYAGDSNHSPSTSTSVTQMVTDFAISAR